MMAKIVKLQKSPPPIAEGVYEVELADVVEETHEEYGEQYRLVLQVVGGEHDRRVFQKWLNLKPKQFTEKTGVYKAVRAFLGTGDVLGDADEVEWDLEALVGNHAMAHIRLAKNQSGDLINKVGDLMPLVKREVTTADDLDAALAE
jgi:hypothetical protein